MFSLQAACDIQAALPRLPQPKPWSAPPWLPAEYVNLVSHIDTQILSADAVLWTACVARHHNSNKQQDLLWADDVDAETRSRFWLFAEDGQGDVYVLDEHGQCYFADHDAGSLHPSAFIPLRLDFMGWLQLADLMGQADALLDEQDDLSAAQIAAFEACLAQLHPDLPVVFPFKW